ncbi:hypothetical protein ABH926_003039 [Catenulispora sp. GP43]|uniref:hypothetical protein n=1 Tax=Catenulispora sp. GP43 TaxID=3156263 RepID=UPI00351300C5
MVKRGAVWGFGAVTGLAVAFTVYLGDRAHAVTADEHAFDRARPCAAQGLGPGAQDPDCVENITVVAAESPEHKDRSQTVTLTVATSATDVNLTFPRGVGAAFDRIRIGDSVVLTSWRGQIVAATAQGDTEVTPAAPSERYRSRLVGVFFVAAFTLVLVGMTLLSAMLTEWFDTALRRRVRFFTVSVVMFAALATTVGAAVLMQGGSLGTALLTVPIVVVAGVVVAGGVVLWRLFRTRREVDAFMRGMAR